MTFTGERLVITPPTGVIVAEAKIEADGTVSILAFDDVPHELTRVADAGEAERFAREIERDAAIGSGADWADSD